MKKCRMCGAPVSPEARFCSRCGAQCSPDGSGNDVPFAGGAYAPNTNETYAPNTNDTYDPNINGTYSRSANGTYTQNANGTYSQSAGGTYTRNIEETSSPTPVGGRPKNRGLLTTLMACAVSACLVICFLVFLNKPETDGSQREVRTDGEAQTEGETEAEEGEKPEIRLSFSAPAYETEANQEMDMSSYLQCQGIPEDEVVWTSDSEDLTVGSKGHVMANGYGVSGTLRASSKSDESVKAECVIRTRTQEEDFVYQVESLNGQHSEDETDEQGVVRLAYTQEENQKIDVDAPGAKAGKRDKDSVWDPTIFYTLEDVDTEDPDDGQINSCHVEKKKFINADTGNEMEYEIYHHPETDVIQKIVSIEYKEKKLAIVEYYYTDAGKVNFVYSYSDVNYTPSYATPNRSGQRYLFNGKDAMVTWRIIRDGKETNYCCGRKEQKRVERSGHGNTKLYENCGEELRKKYDKKEKKILRAAYNTMDKVVNYEGVGTISGHLQMASGEGLEGATVDLKSSELDQTLVSTITNEDGYYEIMVPMREMDYSLRFAKNDYLEENLYEIQANKDEINLNQEAVYLSEKDDKEYHCELTFYDALNRAEDGMGMAALDHLRVVIRRGVNNRTGDPVYDDSVTGSSLSISLSPGMYTVQMVRDGYMDSYNSFFVSGETGNALAIYATPELEEDEYRIVLTWDDVPADLDSHLFVPQADTAEDAHICYYHMWDRGYDTSLDVDDTDGYGPETITISHIRRGQYKYYVCDFTNCSLHNEESRQMSGSSATVRVYGSQGLLQTFFVPVNRPGVIWEVFEIRDGKVIPTQRYYDSIGNRDWWSAMKGM